MSSSDKEQPVGFIPLRIQIIKNYAAFDKSSITQPNIYKWVSNVIFVI